MPSTSDERDDDNGILTNRLHILPLSHWMPMDPQLDFGESFKSATSRWHDTKAREEMHGEGNDASHKDLKPGSGETNMHAWFRPAEYLNITCRALLTNETMKMASLPIFFAAA